MEFRTCVPASNSKLSDEDTVTTPENLAAFIIPSPAPPKTMGSVIFCPSLLMTRLEKSGAPSLRFLKTMSLPEELLRKMRSPLKDKVALTPVFVVSRLNASAKADKLFGLTEA